jgi:hypothetical protein
VEIAIEGGSVRLAPVTLPHVLLGKRVNGAESPTRPAAVQRDAPAVSILRRR